MIHMCSFSLGNSEAKFYDNIVMECESARLAISEAIDEGHAVAPSVEAHVENCSGCLRWRDAAHQLRRATLRPVAEPEQGKVSVSRVPERFAANRWIRFALAWAGVLLIVWNFVPMFAPGTGSAIHLERHRAAFDVALGTAFLFVAWRPDRAYGMVPFAATFTFALSISAVIDLLNGASTPLRESAHLIELGGLGLLWALGLALGPGSKRSRNYLRRSTGA